MRYMFFFFCLEKDMRNEYEIHAFVFKVAAALAFQIRPQCMDIVEMLVARIFPENLKRLFLNINCKDFARTLNPFSDGDRKKSGARAEVGYNHRPIEIQHLYDVARFFKLPHSSIIAEL